MLTAALIVAVPAGLALVLISVRLVQWVYYAWRDARDERRAADLLPHLSRAHGMIRQMHAELNKLKDTAALLQRTLLGRSD